MYRPVKFADTINVLDQWNSQKNSIHGSLSLVNSMYLSLGVLHALAWAKNTLRTRPCLSGWQSRYTYEVHNPHDQGHCCLVLLLEHIVLNNANGPLSCNTDTKTMLHNNGNRGNIVGIHRCLTITLDNISATMTYVMWRENTFGIFVYSKVHLSNLVISVSHLS
jgi:hypothetical protein